MNRQRMNLLLGLVFITVLILSGCTGHPSLNALDPQGSAGEKQLNLINWSLLLMVGVFTIVITIFIYVLIRYRKRKGEDRMPEQVHGNTKLEIIWTAIPIIALVALAFPTVKYTFELAEKPTGDIVNVKVKGYQYWWEFEYPDLGIKTAQELVIPVNKKVHIEIEGYDVLHSFWVPALGGKMDVIPGRTNTMWLDAKKPGTYQGKCAELCGPGHALMDFKVYAKSDAEYDQWVKMMQQPVAKATSEVDKKGEELFKQNCMGCHAGSNSNLKTKGPELSKFGTRNTIAGILPHTEKDLREWLQRPDEIKPGTRMPRIDYLEKDELEALVHYLMSRKPVMSK